MKKISRNKGKEEISKKEPKMRKTGIRKGGEASKKEQKLEKT
jgi:hypothetical protein